jgi:hypothetical protein
MSSNSDIQALADKCAILEGCFTEALSWINQKANMDRLQLDKVLIEHELRRELFQLRKLAQSIPRPMCVAVFGESQAGKSYLVSGLAGQNGRVAVSFDGASKELDFLRDINPSGGEESTALVTRFTIHPIQTPAGYPVSLRFHSQADVAKIIANTYAFDVAVEFEKQLAREEVEAHISALEALVGTDYADTLREEDLWDLQDYFEKHLKRFEHARILSSFWKRIARLAPRLSIERRAELFSIFWGRYPELTKLYVDLVQTLARLNFASKGFCQLDALLPSDSSIINVKSLLDLGAPKAAIPVVTPNGAAVEIPKAFVTALVAELVIVVKQKPRDFFEYTDFLDFPGYRSRLELRLPKLLSDEPQKTLKDLFCRGKVDFLFRQYNVDQEVTGMVLCADDTNPEVKSIAPVVNSWIESTHGAKPADRAGRPVLLFFCMTKFDRQFIDKPGDAGNEAARFDTRVNTSLLERYGNSADSWPVTWTPEQPFKNSYLIRNPTLDSASKFIQSRLPTEGLPSIELAMREETKTRLVELRSAFCAAPNVQNHVTEPKRAWDELLKLNDGGIDYLAENLTKVCSPEIKPQQINIRLNAIRSLIAERLTPYYVATDVAKRLSEREAVYSQILEDLDECLSRDRFGSLLSALCVDRVPLGNALYVARATGFDSDPSDEEADHRPTDKKNRLRDRILGTAPKSRPDGNRLINSRFGATAVTMWINHMRTVAQSEAFARTIGIRTSMLKEIVVEISGAAQRRRVSEAIAARLERILHIENAEATVQKVTVVASTVINSFVTSLGYRDIALDRRPTVMGEDGVARPIFQPAPIVHDANGIGEKRSGFGLEYAIDWCEALKATVLENASSADGVAVDAKQNQRLGEILAQLEGAV